METSGIIRHSALVLFAFLMPLAAPAQSTIKGDVNGDGVVNISDVNAVISIILGEQTQEVEDQDYVDLGLPRGTLWATRNIGANSPEDYGDYFAWGETTPKQTYDWSTYTWCDGSKDVLTKYNTDSGYGTVDNMTELDPADDAATVNWGPSWRMPSVEQMNELLTECNWQWTAWNGVNGYLLTSKHNGNLLFLPAAGCRYEGSLYGAGDDGAYWSRTLCSDDPCVACYLILHSGYVHYWSYYDRIYGQSVRPVRASQQ